MDNTNARLLQAEDISLDVQGSYLSMEASLIYLSPVFNYCANSTVITKVTLSQMFYIVFLFNMKYGNHFGLKLQLRLFTT